MKNVNKYVIIVLLAVLAVSCTEVKEGYLSNAMLYARNPQKVTMGAVTTSQKPDFFGTSAPFYVSVDAVVDDEGNDARALLMDSLPILAWKQTYNKLTDTTLERIMAKLDTTLFPITSLQERSGVFTFSQASSQLASGSMYHFDVKVKNIAGEAIYKKVLSIIAEGKPWQLAGGVYEYIYYSPTESCPPSGGIDPDKGDVPANEYFGLESYFNITYTPGEPTPETRNMYTIELIITDKDGKYFKAIGGGPTDGTAHGPTNVNSEILLRGDRNHFGQHTLGMPKFTDSSIIYYYPFAPFPFNESETFNFFRINRRICDVDGNTGNGYEREKGLFYPHPTFAIKFNNNGFYKVKVRLFNVAKLPAMLSRTCPPA